MMRSGQKVMFRKVSACVLALAVVCGGAVPASAAVTISDADREKYQDLAQHCEVELQDVYGGGTIGRDLIMLETNRGYFVDSAPGNPSMWGGSDAVSYTHLTLPTTLHECRSRWSPYH